MTMRRITLKDGPLNGKTYDVPHDTYRIHADGGTYRLTKTTAKWHPTRGSRGTVETTSATDEAKADR